MDMIKNFITYRNKIAKLYIKSLKNLDLKFQKIPSRVRSTYHLFIIRVNKTIKKKLFEEFINNKILVNTHYIPIHTHPFYKKKGFKNGDFKVSENYYKESISIPIFYNLKNSEQIKVIKIIKKFIKIRNK